MRTFNLKDQNTRLMSTVVTTKHTQTKKNTEKKTQKNTFEHYKNSTETCFVTSTQYVGTYSVAVCHPVLHSVIENVRSCEQLKKAKSHVLVQKNVQYTYFRTNVAFD